MRKKQNKKNIYWAFGVIVIGIAVYIFFQSSNSNIQEFETSTQVEETRQEEVVLTATTSTVKKQNVVQVTSSSSQIVFPKASFIISDKTFEFSLTEEMTVYDAMNLLKEEDKLTFEGKNYPALGFFVTQVGSLKSGDGKNLMYYINGKEASLGISSYIIKEGDIIEWKLK